MAQLVSWKIFYDDREPYSSEDGSPEEAPMDGVQVIVQHWDNGTKQRLHTNDFYYWINGKQWVDGNQADLERWLRREIPNIKYGRSTDDDTFRKIMGVAFLD